MTATRAMKALRLIIILASAAMAIMAIAVPMAIPALNETFGQIEGAPMPGITLFLLSAYDGLTGYFVTFSMLAFASLGIVAIRLTALYPRLPVVHAIYPLVSLSIIGGIIIALFMPLIGLMEVMGSK